jgi:hypothetical protein
MRRVPYAEAIGHILWPAMVTRPDIVFQVGILSQFVQNPGKPHWEALKRAIIYLNTTKDLWLTLGGKGNENPIVFTDADWASQADRHSISGYAMKIGVGAVTWSSKKQPVIALSSTESEYIGQTHSLKEILWVREFLGELTTKFSCPTPLYSDNQGAIALAKNNKFHARSSISIFAIILSAKPSRTRLSNYLTFQLPKMSPTFSPSLYLLPSSPCFEAR